ncbi:TPR repeat [Desulfuromonas acetoxidans DSM 684]|uniref:TPR repeat n=1 Tax=Desulfuromonas acetoxidans (strain DSM 684 / 11070) TaxID=281689 RepID=Q1JV96_DESA6|nr:TPR repeat [Desulfuromonas acetoxidans DSM 684]
MRNCEYGAEHQKVDPKYENAHLTAISAQNLLKEKKPKEALEYYEAARREMEHPNVGADKGEDIYINYGFVMNDIGVIHLSWALYGKELDTERTQIDMANIDPQELQTATQALREAIDFYERWYKHNPNDYERYSKAISESYANLGVALKYAGKTDEAVAAFAQSLLRNPKNGNAERSLTMLEINPKPYIEAGQKEMEKH